MSLHLEFVICDLQAATILSLNMEFVICKLLVKLQNRAVKSIKSQSDIEEAKDLMFNITFHSFENCTSSLWLMFEVQLRCILMVRGATTVEDTSQ